MESKRAESFEEDPRPAPAGAKAKAFRTLVVDAGHFMTPVLEKALEAQGLLILTADSAQGALDLTRQMQPDLILLDSGIDGGQNLELLGELLIEQSAAAVIVVARSGSITEAVEAMKMGALDYLEGPLDAVQLAQVCETQRAWFKVA